VRVFVIRMTPFLVLTF